ncbi:hypothetical protein [Qipengyuania sp. ASV99]|uniref:hypothetical protein n=1 Tax=Qipengyuania sp. ASV99 TaxID=3399681 RepID=UPI003A4C845A
MLTDTNPPPSPLPWLVQSEPDLSSTYYSSRESRQNRRARQLRLGIEVGLTVLCGGMICLLLWPSAQPVPAVDLVEPAQTAVTAVAPATVETDVADNEALIATPLAITHEAAPQATMTKAAPKPQTAAPVIAYSSVAEQANMTDAAPVVAPLAPPVDETSASAATIAELRSVIEESREDARLVIRLASRQRPSRNASAEELTSYDLRQQNAEAARGYRRYLDRLKRSMRGSPSKDVGQQLLEQARQTQAYLKTMLEDSQASLR